MKSWLQAVLSAVPLLLPIASAGADAVAAAPGERQFSKCMACHSLEKGVNLMGPSLAGLSGRKAGTASGFAYSTAMQQSVVVWNRETLSAFLESPVQYIPGNAMPFAGLSKRDQREALVDFLLRH